MGVVNIMMPTPAIWTPPWGLPQAEGKSSRKPKAESSAPTIGKAGAETVRVRPANPSVGEVRRVLPARAVDDHVLRANDRA